MKRLRIRGNRFWLAVLTGILITGLSGRISVKAETRNVTAWWGSIYPEFCFCEPQKTDENTVEIKENGQKPQLKISFWLAKALDRW